MAKSNGSKRLLLILPRLAFSESDKIGLPLLQSLSARGWETTIATSADGDHSSIPEFSIYTADIFPMHHFLESRDYPVFLRYLIESRQPDITLLLNSDLAYLLLPYLRAAGPDTVYLDYRTTENEHDKTSIPERFSVGSESQLDLTVVSSFQLRDWMCDHGADPARIEVCGAGAKTDSSAVADRMEELFAKARLWKEREPRQPIDHALAKDIAMRSVQYMRVYTLAERLAEERDKLRATVRSIGELPAQVGTDPNTLAREIIGGTLRYRLCDRVNDFLKKSRLQAPIKTILKAVTSRHK